MKRGAYILKDCEGTPEVILIATGSEVQLAVSAAEALAGKGRKARVVSMPCAELFDAQPAEYKENVLPRAVRARVAVEAASVDGWWKYVGLDGAVGRHVRLWRVRPRATCCSSTSGSPSIMSLTLPKAC